MTRTILSKTITKDGVSRSYIYGYNDTNWKDKLTSFDGQNILYDQIGNPLSLNGATLGWTQGRKLSTYTKDGTTAYYTYDENGIRKSKYVNGTTTEYLTSGGEVVAQKTGSNTITYTRGADGSLISMNRNGTIYYYQTNLQGDVEKILDGNGTAVVSYTYDAYGRITSMTGDQTLGQENPFRYRSYFFDQESGFYYLQSRYYDPMMGRFISADDRLVENGNMFSYCGNNPVMNLDPDGHKKRSIFQSIIKKVMDQVNKYIKVRHTTEKKDPTQKPTAGAKNTTGGGITLDNGGGSNELYLGLEYINGSLRPTLEYQGLTVGLYDGKYYFGSSTNLTDKLYETYYLEVGWDSYTVGNKLEEINGNTSTYIFQEVEYSDYPGYNHPNTSVKLGQNALYIVMSVVLIGYVAVGGGLVFAPK